MNKKFSAFNALIRRRNQKNVPYLALGLIGFFAVASIVLSQRLLQSVGSPGRSQAASSDTMQSSFENAKNGRVLVNVALNVPFTPEGNLTPEQVQSQQSAIKTSRDGLLKTLPIGSYKVISSYENIPHMVLEIDKNAFTVLKQSPKDVVKITDYNAVPEAELFLSQSVPFIGTQTAYDLGDDASNQVIGIIDSGVDLRHPALVDKVIDGACFTTATQPAAGSTTPSLLGNDCAGQPESFGVEAGAFCDPAIAGCEHGTKVASIAAGGGTPNGVAKGANIVSVRVQQPSTQNPAVDCRNVDTLYCRKAGSNPVDWTKALVWLYNQKDKYPLAVVNMSLGSGLYKTQSDCLAQYPDMQAAIQNLVSAGIPVVASTGNSGNKDAISFPACLPTVVAAAASTRYDPTPDQAFSTWNANQAARVFPFPAANANENNFSIRWTGNLVSPSAGTYRIVTHFSGAIKVTLNGGTILDTQNNFYYSTSEYGTEMSVPLNAGNNPIVVEYRNQDSNRAQVRLLWESTTAGIPLQIIPAANLGGGLTGTYFNTVDFSGSPLGTKVDPQVNFIWLGGSDVVAAGPAFQNTGANPPLPLNLFFAPGEAINAGVPGGGYVISSGTSFAAPHIAGLVAILKQANPVASWNNLVGALRANAPSIADTRGGSMGAIHPRVSVPASLEAIKLMDNTTACASTANSTQTSCSHDGGGVLGSSTSSVEGEVLQATSSQYVNMALVTVSYAPTTANSDSVVQSAKYCLADMVRVNPTPATGARNAQTGAGGMKTEMFYLLNPSLGDCDVTIQHSKVAGERIISTTILHNVLSSAPLASYLNAGNTYTSYPLTPFTVNMDTNGTKDTLPVCAYGQYSEQSSPPTGNIVTALLPSRQMWKYEPFRHRDAAGNETSIANIWGGVVGGVQRTASGSQRVSWKFAKTMPWAAMCANFNVKPFATIPTVTPPPVTPAPPTPTPPTPPPPAVTSVDLKVNGSNGPITIANNKAVSLTWTSANATSCVASNAWTGTKAVSGSFTTPLLTADKTYTITCTGASGTKSDSVTVIVTKAPIVDLKINGSDTSVTFDKGIAPTLGWSQTGATSCTASGGWSGTKALTGGSEKGAVLGNSTSYTLTCTNASGSASDTVSVNATANTAPLGYLNKYYTDTNMQQFFGEKVTSSINYDWGTTGVPMPGMPQNWYSARYSAQITPSVTGTYTFLTTSDDGVRLYIDEMPVITNWAYHGRTLDYGYVTLVAGKQYDLVMDFVESSGGSTMILQAGINDGPAPITPKAAPLTVGSNGGGLTTEYFGSGGLTSTPLATVREPVMEALWVTAPTSLLPLKYYAARMTGTMVPKVSGTYSFSLSPDARMWINEVEKIATVNSSGIANPVTHAMTANTSYNIRFETPLGDYRYFYVRYKYGTQPLRPLDFNLLRPVPASTNSQQPSPPQSVPTQSGLKATYFDKRDLTGNSITRIDPFVQFYWSGAAPATSIPASNFSARWTGTLVVPTTGSYTFYTEADDGMRVTVGGQQIINKWTWETHSGVEQSSSPITLTAGDHPIVVEYNQGTGGAKAVLRWAGPGITKRVIQESNLKSTDSLVPGVRASYFNNETLTGTSVNQTDPSINFLWDRSAPAAGVNADQFSVRWTGIVMAPAVGSYTFYTEADDGIRVWVDGVQRLDYWWWQSHYGAEKASAPITLTPGPHTVTVEAHDGSGGAKAIVRWSGPNIAKEVLPLYLD